MITTRGSYIREAMARRTRQQEVYPHLRRRNEAPTARIPPCGMEPLPSGPRITCITPTGDRPLAFTLCQLWMARQRLKPDQWIVVDDGRAPTRPIVRMAEYTRRIPGPREPRITLSLNLLKAADLVRGDLVFIIEDDDYYAPGYIADLAAKLGGYEIVGIGRARYYHISTGRYFRHPNMAHASLGSTAFRRSVIADLKVVAGVRSDFIDMLLWPKVAGRPGLVFFDEDAAPLHCSVKAMPGRRGASHGHDQRATYYKRDDPSYSLLKVWTGGAADIYVGIARGTLGEREIMARVEQEVGRWNS